MVVLGAVMLVVGALLVLVEAHVPTAGVVGGIAVVALIAGIATLLAAAGAPGLLVLGLALLALGTGVYAPLLLGRSLVRFRRIQPRTGAEALVGHVGVPRREAAPHRRVFVDRLVRVSLRTVTLRVPAQDVITRDNVPARVTAVTYFRVVDPNKSIVEIQDVLAATSQIAQTTLRSILGKADLDTLLAEREKLNEDLQQIIDDQTEPWGIKVTTVEIKDVEIPEDMQRAIARQAEAERERRAKIINAEGEFQAAAKLADAADVISQNPVTIQLRYLQTLLEIGGEQNSTVVFPLPIDLIGPLLDAVKDRAGGGASPPG